MDIKENGLPELVWRKNITEAELAELDKLRAYGLLFEDTSLNSYFCVVFLGLSA